jgi:hypothetical protein
MVRARMCETTRRTHHIPSGRDASCRGHALFLSRLHRQPNSRCAMDDDYYSIDSILAETQVSVILHSLRRAQQARKYNARSKSISLKWATLTAGTNAT